MSHWRITARPNDCQCIDGSIIDASRFAALSADEISRLSIRADGQLLAFGDLFEIEEADSGDDLIVVSGDVSNVHSLAASHSAGRFRIEGSVGDYLGCRMVGGTVEVTGDAGDFVGAPSDASRIGMRGGLIKVHGRVGDHCGHRMRRGCVSIGASAGTLVAASMVAGTIIVAGSVGDDLAVGMKRGTVIVADGSSVSRQFGDRTIRFSDPQSFSPGFFRLLPARWMSSAVPHFESKQAMRVRADRSNAGQGEIIYPVG